MWMDSEDIVINEYFLKGSTIYKLNIELDKIHSFFLVSGNITIDDKYFLKGDFFTISNLDYIEIDIIESSKLFEISSPIKPSYSTYIN